MARRVFRILLVLVLAALVGVAGWQAWSLDRTRTQQRAGAERLQRDALRVAEAILDIRASQRAYLSPGQGIAAWKPRVDTHIATLREQFTALREQASASESPFAAAAAQADDEALDAMVATKYLEQRIADHVAAGRIQHAADLVYADGVRVSLTLERAANAAFMAHAQDLRAARTRVQRTEGALLALAAAIGFVLAWLVIPGLRAAAEAGTADATDGAAERVAGERAVGEAARGAGAVGAAGARTAGIAGRRSEPAAQGGLGLAPAARAAGAAGSGATTAAGASSLTPARGGSKGAGTGRTAPAAGGRVAPPAAAPAITMPDDLPLHASATSLSTAAAGSTTMGAAAPASPKPARGPAAASGMTAPSSGPGSAEAVAVAAPVNGLAVQTEDGLLAAAAELTMSVATVGDVDGLKPVMARLAEHLDAVGVIVWLEDASSQRLTPIVTHGYPAETLAHLRPIDLDADNATARAWRLAELQIVAGRGAHPGAIVVPMPSSAGCVGVVAAEVRHGREHDPSTLALARILAAQLAMLTGQRG
jgi:hypothetical protein